MDGETDAAAAPKLITVHGTGAGSDEAQRDRWWQIGSPFMIALAERLKTPSEPVPFQWGLGDNSEEARRKAGAALLKTVQEEEKQGNAYYLIGHSHGGSVIYSALLHATRSGITLPGLMGWCTVGTPFMDYTPNKRMWQRMGEKSLSVFVSGVFAAIAAVIYVIFGLIDYDTATSAGHEYVVAGVMAGYALSAFLLLKLLERMRRKWFDRKHKLRLEEQFGHQWLGLWHNEDEAIAALSNVRHVYGDLVPPSFLKPAILVVQIIAVAIIGLGLINLVEDFVTIDDPGAFLAIFVLVALIVIAVIVFLIVWLISWVLKKLLGALGYPLAGWINRIVWRSVRERSWGDDIGPEEVSGVSANPPDFKREFAPLPEVVAAPLRGHSDRNAISTLNKVRRILGMAQGEKVSPDLRGELNDSLQWDELIHTSYFDVPEFVDLVALGLSRAGLGALRDGFVLPKSERDALETWLSGNPTLQE
ncbi:hypothetical protein AIOL_003055 [Candidatus Rhodobacter oscarellae]|uniref:Uncharacterized protein n=1 Tax=Candidatus Rhodobacter oscarellae TaxID=1675527 RepID=A0A0J9E5Q3_9RHOB|nr:hypothetical protein [Candidatus Rhodobacter lobularis]KMW58085.1 hypothetical protein AIOL_003055 [Candidatus Rhodobacter lobularis]